MSGVLWKQLSKGCVRQSQMHSVTLSNVRTHSHACLPPLCFNDPCRVCCTGKGAGRGAHDAGACAQGCMQRTEKMHGGAEAFGQQIAPSMAAPSRPTRVNPHAHSQAPEHEAGARGQRPLGRGLSHVPVGL